MKKLSERVYVSTEYPGVNVGFIKLPDGVVAVDVPTLPSDAEIWHSQVIDVTGGKIRYVVLTDTHPDRLLSAGMMKAPVIASQAAYDRAVKVIDGLWKPAAETWARLYPQAAKALAKPHLALPEIILTSRLTLHRGTQSVTIECIDGAAPGSVWLHLSKENILFAGDTVVAGVQPRMEATLDSRAWLDTLKRLRRSAFTKTTIVPGRGPLCDQSATRPLSDYIALVRRRARSLRKDDRAKMGAATTELLELFPGNPEEQESMEQQAMVNLEQAIRKARGS